MVDVVGEVQNEGFERLPVLRPTQVFESMWQLDIVLKKSVGH